MSCAHRSVPYRFGSTDLFSMSHLVVFDDSFASSAGTWCSVSSSLALYWISCCSLSVAGRFESGGIAVSAALDVAVVERLMVDVLVAGRRDRSGESF